jgi:hypothetical protein
MLICMFSASNREVKSLDVSSRALIRIEDLWPTTFERPIEG